MIVRFDFKLRTAVVSKVAISRLVAAVTSMLDVRDAEIAGMV